jgi:hypothetical protein
MNVEFEAVLPCLFDGGIDHRYFADLKYVDQQVELKQLDADTMDWPEIRKSLKRKGDICGDCRYDRVCEGYWMEYVTARGFSEFRPVR